MMAPLSIKHFGWSWRELKLKKTILQETARYILYSVPLYIDRQIDEMIKFLTDPKEFSVFGTDPTFNIFNEDLSFNSYIFQKLKIG